MIRVVMLSPGFHPYVGGAEKQALELSRALAAAGAGVTVLTRRLKGLAPEEEVTGIPVRRTAAWGGGLLNALVFMASSLLYLLSHRTEYDVIHVHLAGSPALSACLAARWTRKKVVVKVGGGRGIGELAVSGRTLAGRVKLALLRRLRPRFIAVTRDLVAELAEHGLAEGAEVVPNGVDTGRYRPAGDEAKAALRGGLGWPEGLCFLYVGRLAPEKQLDGFLRAFAEGIKKKSKDPFFVMVGSGPEEEGLRAEIARLGLEERARILPPTDEIEKCYAAADVFVLPSVSEGLSNALLEAMASGLAVLGSRVGGTKEAVEEGVTGLLFDPSDSGEMEVQLGRFLKEPSLAGLLGNAAQQVAARDYSLESTAERYLELYKE